MTEQKISREELQRLMSSRSLTAVQQAQLKQLLDVSTADSEVKVEDGFEFLRQLRKEARRQKAMQKAELLELQALDINNVPQETYSNIEEVHLADSFEVIDEE